jgi:hypothetical protein
LFLCTFANGSYGIYETLKFFDLLRDMGWYPGIRFFGIILAHRHTLYKISKREVVR